VETPLLLNLLGKETEFFHRVDHQWRPKGIFYEIQTQVLMKDMIRRYTDMNKAQEELMTLERADVYTRLMTRLELVIRRAAFVRRSNHLAFAQDVADFYSFYGEVLRRLMIDKVRGKLQPAAI
jgi:hypothetical protein